jgi:4-amino-4-deoxy-L-arabinose transferase-like glycosyltransferase
MGVYLVEGFRTYGLASFDPRSQLELFGENYNPDHPPLGRLWLGLHHHVTQWLCPVEGVEGPFVTASARTGSAVAFALTVLLCGLFIRKYHGALAGTAASLSLALMPRLFGHAHLAALETVTNLFWMLSLLAVANWWPARLAENSEAVPSNRCAAATGLLLGLALLTKIQAILIPPIVITWAFFLWRSRAVRPLLIWLLSGAVVFIAGWPWLWLDLPGHLIQYLARTTDRAVLTCYYFGQRFADREVPWHYPLLVFLGTVSVATHLLATLGLSDQFRNRGRAAGDLLLTGAVIGSFVLFALPGVAVYDGERLFLTAFPAWAMLAGTGTSRLRHWLQARGMSVRARQILIGGVLLLPLPALWMPGPVWLSAWSETVGFLPGAAKLGLELSYWGDSFTRPLLQDLVNRAEPGATVEVAPVLHQFQLEEMTRQLPLLRQAGLKLVPFSSHQPAGHWLLIFERRASVPEESQLRDLGWQPVAELSRQGVVLARLWRHP